MRLPRFLSTLNLGNVLVCAGVGLLAFCFWIPYATAERVHRVETRADSVAATILAVARERQPEFTDPDASARFVAAVNHARRLDDPDSSLYVHAEEVPAGLQGQCLCFRDKHYLFLVVRTPARFRPGGREIESPAGKEGPGAVAPPPLPASAAPFEVYAWPGSEDGIAHAVFFHASDARSAFARNLGGRYGGLDKAPRPGDARIRDLPSGAVNGYQGYDGERWIYQGEPT
jgi:hypothetical protein